MKNIPCESQIFLFLNYLHYFVEQLILNSAHLILALDFIAVKSNDNF